MTGGGPRLPKQRPAHRPGWGAPAALALVLAVALALTTVIVSRPADAQTDSGERKPIQLHTRYLTDLPYTAVSNRVGPVERDQTNGGAAADDGAPIELGGQRFDRGLGVHALSHVRVYPAGACERLLAVIGLPTDAGPQGTVRFTVLGDERLLYQSRPVGTADGAVAVEVDVNGVQRLELLVGDARDGADGDSAAWADARLECRP
jgi:alpha-galactosidase